MLAVGWLGAMLWSAQATISAGAGGLAITAAAYSLPGVISAVLVGGAALGLVAVSLLDRRSPGWPVDRAGPARAAALGAGLVTGVGGAATVIAATAPARRAWCSPARSRRRHDRRRGRRAARPAPGGGARWPPRWPSSRSGSCSTCFKSPLLSLYGLGETRGVPAQRVRLVRRHGRRVGSGLAAGLVAFRYLRRAVRRAERTALRWPAYLVAGAGPGLLLLVAELITRVGGARVLDLAGALSDNDRTVQAWLDGSRINYALVVLFVGAMIAMIAFGRTLPADDRRPATRRRRTGQSTSVSSSDTSYHSSSWSSAPSTVNCASGSPASASSTTTAAAATSAAASAPSTWIAATAPSRHRRRQPHARSIRVRGRRAAPRRRAGRRRPPPGGAARRVPAQQLQRALGGAGERDVLQLLLVALGVPLAQRRRDRVRGGGDRAQLACLAAPRASGPSPARTPGSADLSPCGLPVHACATAPAAAGAGAVAGERAAPVVHPARGSSRKRIR